MAEMENKNFTDKEYMYTLRFTEQFVIMYFWISIVRVKFFRENRGVEEDDDHMNHTTKPVSRVWNHLHTKDPFYV